LIEVSDLVVMSSQQSPVICITSDDPLSLKSWRCALSKKELQEKYLSWSLNQLI